MVSVEKRLQNSLLQKNKSKIEDKIFRAWWTLKSARQLTYKEFLKCSSHSRLGVYLGLLPFEALEIFNVLQVKTGPGHIEIGEDASELTPEKMAETRATMVRLSLQEFDGA